MEHDELPLDEPKLLGNPAARKARSLDLRATHMQRLNALVETIRSDTQRGDLVPNFDPADGGTNARCLYLLEAPGRRAVQSGFVSRNNSDETAKNFFELNRTAGIRRQETVIWNVVPWYVGSGRKIRPALRADIEAAKPYLTRLLADLTRLEIVVLVGKKACFAKEEVMRCVPHIKLITMPHPSPLFINRLPTNRALILGALNEVAQILAASDKRRADHFSA